MSSLRESLKQNLPAPLVGVIRDTRDWLKRTAELPQASLHPWRRDTIHRLGLLKDTHLGERCFIIGNGPSLRNTDLSLLKSEYTIGMNRIFLGFEEMGFKTSCLVSVNDLVIEQSAAELQALDMPRFFSWRARKWLQPADDLFFLHTTYTGPQFQRDLTARLWEGATVTYTCLQLAYYLGFSTAVLIGVDHNFTTQGKPNTTITSQGDDPNHFHPGYFGKGFRWQLPDLECSEIAYAMAHRAFEADNRMILDATVGGKLQVFTKVDYSTLFPVKPG